MKSTLIVNVIQHFPKLNNPCHHKAGSRNGILSIPNSTVMSSSDYFPSPQWKPHPEFY